MIALNFKEQFADAVATGKKTQTIRRTNRFKVGDALQLYTGQRTKKCRKLGEAVVTGICDVCILKTRILVGEFFVDTCKASLNEFAHEDGFKDFKEMKAFFVAQYGDLPFKGYLIEWELQKAEGA